MANFNIPLTIERSAKTGLLAKYTFGTVTTTGDYFIIPYRYPDGNISNFTALTNEGFFRHPGTKTFESTLGGSNVANANTTLGYQLPPTDRLTLLIKKGATTAETFKVKYSSEYRLDEVTITVPSGAVGDIYEFSLSDLGLQISDISGIYGAVYEVTSITLGFCLVARLG